MTLSVSCYPVARQLGIPGKDSRRHSLRVAARMPPVMAVRDRRRPGPDDGTCCVSCEVQLAKREGQHARGPGQWRAT